VETAQIRRRQKASSESKLVFNSLYHHVYDVEHLRACYETLDGRKAVGIDGVDKEVYKKQSTCLMILSIDVEANPGGLFSP